MFGKRLTVSSGHVQLVVVGLTAVFAVAGVVATRSIARQLARVSEARDGVAAGSAIRLICLMFGYGVVGLGVLTLLRLNLGNLVVGGAVTGVIIQIAAQQTLGNSSPDWSYCSRVPTCLDSASSCAAGRVRQRIDLNPPRTTPTSASMTWPRSSIHCQAHNPSRLAA